MKDSNFILSDKDLAILSNQFISFLIINGIDSESWEKMKQTDNDRAKRLLLDFERFVFETKEANIEHLIKILPKTIYLFHLKDAEIVLYGLEYAGNDEIDFTISNNLVEQINSVSAAITTFSQSKNYVPNRKEEIIRMIKSGCTILSHNEFAKWINLWE